MPILREGELDIMSHSSEQTRRLGYRLGKLLTAGDIVCLCGDMGTGKTVFSSGIGLGWGAQEPLTSPTHALLHQHQHAETTHTLYHLDCYRMQSLEDIEAIGFEDLLDGQSTILIEWAERIENLLPESYLWVDLRAIEATKRNFLLNARGKHYQTLIESYRHSIFGV